ncbi:MAG: hypothetical protein ABIH42_03205 [Planctomycetota bacterium]
MERRIQDSAAIGIRTLPTAESDTEGGNQDGEVNQLSILGALRRTVARFFPSLISDMDRLPAPRDRSKITYPAKTFIWVGMLLFVCRLGARCRITFDLGDLNIFIVLYGDTISAVFDSSVFHQPKSFPENDSSPLRWRGGGGG